MPPRRAFLFLTALLLCLSCLAGTSPTGAEPEAESLVNDLGERIIYAHLSWGELGLNTAVKPKGREARSLCIKEKTYEQGLGMHANGTVTIALAYEFERLEAEVGLQWQGGESAGSVVFQVFVDGKKQFDSGIMKETDAPQKVRVPLKLARQLVLKVTDAGDGIKSDVANWVNVRLIRDPEADGRVRPAPVDVAQFASVVTSDPQRVQGTRATRSSEMPADDLALTRELLPEADGSFRVPVVQDGTGCIGLEWREFRYFNEVGLRFANPSAVPEDVQLQQWVGQSSWQGAWQTVDAMVEKRDDKRTWQLAVEHRRKPTDKFRWVFPASAGSVVVEGMSAHTRSIWNAAALRIEHVGGSLKNPVRIDLYNGTFLEPPEGASPTHCEWNPAKPLQIQVRFAYTGQCKTDQTVLRFQTREHAFGVAVDDVLGNEAVYIPIAGLFLTRDPAPITSEAYLQKIANRKSVLDQVREHPEQTFAQAMDRVHQEIQNHGPTMLSLACDQRKFVAYREGSVGFNMQDQPSAVFDGRTHRSMRKWRYRLNARFGDGDYDDLSRRLDGGWLPIPITSINEKGLVYQTRTYVAPWDDEPQAGLPDWLRRRAVCVVEYTVNNTTQQEAEAVLTLAVNDAVKSGVNLSPKTVDGGVVVTKGSRLLTFLDTTQAAPLTLTTDSAATMLAGSLPARGTARVVAYLPAWKVAAGEQGIFHSQADRLAAKTERYWQALMINSAQIDLPDKLLTNVIRASQVHIMLAAGNEENGQRIDPWASSDRYGALESESQPILRAMDMMGHQDFARRGLEFFLARYNQQGFLTTGYTIMGSGWHLWTLAEFVDRTGDLEWFRSVAPEVARMCRWIVRQRHKTRRVDARGEKVPNYGLTPPGVIADWARFTNTTFQAAHYCAGLREAARVLGKIDHPDAEALRQEAEAYREDILRAYRWTQARSPVVPRGDGTWVPAQPPIFFIFGEVGGFFPGEDGSRAWCKNAMAHHLMVNRVMDPCSEQTSWMLDVMEGIEFLRSGLSEPAYDEETNRQCWFDLGGFNKCQPYYRRSVELYALRDEIKPFIRGYFNTIPSLLNLENLTFWEHFHNRGGWNKTHETAWFLCQTRIMLVQERGEELWLAPFVTRKWLDHGKSVDVQNAPTSFGPVSYRIDSAVDQGVIEATIHAPKVNPPNRIVLRLRHPDEKPIKTVNLNGNPHTDYNPKTETIDLVPNSKPLLLRVEY